MKMFNVLLVFAVSGIAAAGAFGRTTEDTLVVGNLDRLPMVVTPGQQVTIPVWFFSHPVSGDSLVFGHVPVATDDDYVTARSEGTFHWPFSEWDDVSFLFPNPASPDSGYTNQSILGFACLTDSCDHGVWLFTNGQYWHIADFILTISSDTLVVGDTTRHMEGWHPQNAGLNFLPSYGQVDRIPNAYYSLLQIERLAGDANFSGEVNGIDVTYLVAYFKTGQAAPRPFISGDTNGDCAVNGIDVIYLVNYLKGVGLPPVRGDCAP